MASIENIKGSDGTGNANVATVQSSRSGGASTIVVDTVQDINPAGFMGTMGTPHTFADPVTSEIITVISEATAVDFSGHVDGSNLEIDDIAPGYVDDGSSVGDIVIIRPTTQWANEVAEVLAELMTNLQVDWQAGSSTWTYVSATTFTVPSADAALMSAGTKLKLTQTTAKYFYVASVSGTTVTISANADYTLANAAITSPYFSNAATPVGFPQSFSWTPTWSTGVTAGNGTNGSKYIQVGKTVIALVRFTFGSTSSMGNGVATFSLPVTSAGGFLTAERIGGAQIVDASPAGEYFAEVQHISTTTARIIQRDFGTARGAAQVFSATDPIAFAAGDSITAQIVYQAA